MNTSTSTYERLQAMRRAEQAAKELAARIKAQATPPETHDQKVARVAGEQVADAKARLATAMPAERDALKRKIAMMGTLEKEAKAKQAEAERIERFRNDAGFKNAQEHQAIFSKNPGVAVPGITAEQVAVCGAILACPDWQSPTDCVQAYWQEVAKIEQAAWAVADKAAADAEHTALRAEYDAANAKLAALEREQALAQARANGGGTDAAQ